MKPKNVRAQLISTFGAEAGGSLRARPAWYIYQVPHSDTLSQGKENFKIYKRTFNITSHYKHELKTTMRFLSHFIQNGLY